jgi:multimeric flavodoxin WrbA
MMSKFKSVQEGFDMADVVAIVGSSRKAGNTEILTQVLLEEIARKGFRTELIALAGKRIEVCRACDTCRLNKCCCIEDDFQPIYPKLIGAKGIILSSPVYSFGPTPQILAFSTRASRVAHSTKDPREFKNTTEYTHTYPHPSSLARKIGATLTVARRAGGSSTLSLLNHFFLRNQMFLVGSTYINVAFGYDKGEALKDKEGVANLRLLGENFAWLMERLYKKRNIKVRT